jgi:hypothetical protein
MKTRLPRPEYPAFLAELKDRVLGARITAARAINADEAIWRQAAAKLAEKEATSPIWRRAVDKLRTEGSAANDQVGLSRRRLGGRVHLTGI